MFYEGFEYKHIIQSKSYGPYGGGGGNVFVLNISRHHHTNNNTSL